MSRRGAAGTIDSRLLYRRSRILALIGLPLLVVAVVLVALSAPETDPNPKAQLAVIFGLVGGFVFLLLIVQGADLRAASRVRTTALLAPGTPVENPMTIPQVDLWAALAIEPVGDEAAQAHEEVWGTVRESHRTAWIVSILIFTCVPMTYLLETFVPVLVGAALIGIVAVIASFRVVGSGGGLDRAYESMDRSLEPLGLSMDERPTVGVTSRPTPPYGLKTDVRGGLLFSGERHGRAVSVAMADGASEVRVAGDVPSFEAKARDGKVRGKRKGELPPAIEEALSSVPSSTAWKGVTARGRRRRHRRPPQAGRRAGLDAGPVAGRAPRRRRNVRSCLSSVPRPGRTGREAEDPVGIDLGQGLT